MYQERFIALEIAFDARIPLKQMAEELGRTPYAVEQRLIKIGKVAAPAGGESNW